MTLFRGKTYEGTEFHILVDVDNSYQAQDMARAAFSHAMSMHGRWNDEYDTDWTPEQVVESFIQRGFTTARLVPVEELNPY